MAAGEGTGDAPGSDDHINTLGGPSSSTKGLAKAMQENPLPSSSIDMALVARSDPKKNQLPKILPMLNIMQDCTESKNKGREQDMRNSNSGHDDIAQNRQSSTGRPIGAVRDGPGIFPSNNEVHINAFGESSCTKENLMMAIPGIVAQAAGSDPAQPNLGDSAAIVAPGGPDPAQLNLGDVAAIVAPVDPPPAQPNVGPIVALHRVAPAQPNVGPIVALLGVGPLEPNVGPIVALLDVGPPEPNVAPMIAVPDVGPPEPNVGPIVPLPGVAPAQRNVAPNVAPPGGAPAQPNAAAIVAPPRPAPAQRNLGGPFEISRGLTRSRLRPLRDCEFEPEGKLWPKLPRN